MLVQLSHVPIARPPTPLPSARRGAARVVAAAVAAVVLAGCAADRGAVTGLAAGNAATRNRVSADEGLASPAWQATAGSLVGQGNLTPIQAGHTYALAGVAEYLALQRAEAAIGANSAATGNSNGNGIGAGGRDLLETDRGAVAGASVAVLSSLFPAQAQMLENLVTTQANAGPGGPHPAFLAAEAIGRAVGAQIIARPDGFGNPNTAFPPVGPGFWTSNVPGTPSAGGQLPQVMPWFLNTANQFRPGPPPVYLSPEYNTALAEIRHISDTRTQQQSDIAAFWAFNAGTPTPPGYWLSIASQEIASHGLSEREATHLYALQSATMFDAAIGCWDAKLTYWLIRPWKADPGIVVLASVGKPNHPSYPSGHSCVSSSAASVLSAFFPEKTADFDAMVIQAGLSRMYGGIHYRFDIDAGQALGHAVAKFTIAKDASGQSVLAP